MERKFIALPSGGCRKLANDFKVTPMTVTRALQFHRDTPTCTLLRAAALERGGRLCTSDSTYTRMPCGKAFQRF